MLRSTITAILFSATVATVAQADTVVTFEDKVLSSNTYYNGSDGAGGFTSGGAFFNNSFTDYGGGFVAWSGFAYSNVSDTTTPGYTNQYASFAGSGAADSDNYAIAYPRSVIDLPAGERPTSVQLTNTTYAALSMRDGDGFAKKFVAGDFLSVTLTGHSASDAAGPVTGAVTFYLADFRPEIVEVGYIVEEWTLVDLSLLGEQTRSITLSFASSDVGQFGINTPTYVALDNLVTTAVPEPASMFGLAAVGMAGLSRRRARIC